MVVLLAVVVAVATVVIVSVVLAAGPLVQRLLHLVSIVVAILPALPIVMLMAVSIRELGRSSPTTPTSTTFSIATSTVVLLLRSRLMVI